MKTQLSNENANEANLFKDKIRWPANV